MQSLPAAPTQGLVTHAWTEQYLCPALLSAPPLSRHAWLPLLCHSSMHGTHACSSDTRYALLGEPNHQLLLAPTQQHVPGVSMEGAPAMAEELATRFNRHSPELLERNLLAAR